MVLVAGGHILDEEVRVDLLAEVVEVGHPLVGGHAVGSLARGVVDAPGLVEEDLHDDGRMVVVTVQVGAERVLIDRAACGLRVGCVRGVHRGGVGHILPDEEAQLVAPVVLQRVFDLQVLTDHVEAVILHGENVVIQGLFARSGVDALGPEALVQQAGQEDGLAVEVDVLVVAAVILRGRNLTQAEVGVDGVEHGAVGGGQGDGAVVQLRVGVGPQLGVRDADRFKGQDVLALLERDLLAAGEAGAGRDVLALFLVPELALEAVGDGDFLLSAALDAQIVNNALGVNLGVGMGVV